MASNILPSVRLLAAGILLSASLAACTDGGTASSGNEAGQEHEEMTMESLPLPKRLAFMSGHVAAGMALYRAGEAGMAAPHLLHPVSETHAAEREGLDALGFRAELFEEVSAALEAGRPAEDIMPQLAEAEGHLRALRGKAGGDPAEIIAYLMDVVVEEYGVAITDGAVSDPGEYQDAWGFIVIAREKADLLEGAMAQQTVERLDSMLRLWPEAAPVPPSSPASVEQVVAGAEQVKAGLVDAS